MLHLMLTLISLLVSLFSIITGIFFILLPHQEWLLWPQRWLQGTPFTDLRVPGFLLLSLVGITNCWGFWSLIKEHPRQYDRSMIGGYCLMAWVVGELLLSRDLYLIHVSAALLGILQVLLAYQQKDKWAV